jgi:SAM-dependent methyltransferase
MPREPHYPAENTDFHMEWAHLYDWVYETSFGNAYTRMTEQTVRKIGNLREWHDGARIADLGAGTGRITAPLLEAGYKVVSIDSSDAMLSVLKTKISGHEDDVEIIAAPLSQFKCEPVDFALCVFTVFIYIADEAELVSSFRNIANHLKPGGMFFFDLASDMFFQSGVVMNHQSAELNRVSTIEHLEGEVFKMTDSISGIRNNNRFKFQEVFNVRRWDIETVSRHLSECGLTLLEFDDASFRFTGSRYFLFQKQEGVNESV